MTTTKVFVYGSLKRNFPNHRVLGSSKFLGSTLTRQRYNMISFGSFPGVREYTPGEDHAQVFGEVYEVDEATFRNLDLLESNGRFYQRKRVRTVHHGLAWMYFLCQQSYPGTRPMTPTIESKNLVLAWY
jgi:gamma-glutamylaminecyclotransferase